MAMDYGDATAANCVLDSSGKRCDTGASAVRAATAINQQYGVPLSRVMVMVTPMIGGNDQVDEVFTIADVTTLVNFARQNGLGGVHFLSLDCAFVSELGFQNLQHVRFGGHAGFLKGLRCCCRRAAHSAALPGHLACRLARRIAVSRAAALAGR